MSHLSPLKRSEAQSIDIMTLFHSISSRPDSIQDFEKMSFLGACSVQLHNQCWQTSTIPQAWRTASNRLIAKGSAKDDPSSPSNFWPIALTSCIGKIFTSILKSGWSTYMLENEYLDPSIQKAFMRATPGCTEHHLKLASILARCKKNNNTNP